MQQYSQSLKNEELLSQTVSDAELREILERIGHDEFNGNPQPTIRDIAEGTSADPATIGRILGEIRKEDWEDRFGLKLKEHEHRIETLETKPPVAPTVIHHYHEVPAPTPVVAQPTSYNQPASPRYGYGSNKRRSSDSTVSAIIFGIFFACFVIVFVAIIVNSNRDHQEALQRMDDLRRSRPLSGFGTNGWPTGSPVMTNKDIQEAMKRANENSKPRGHGVLKGPLEGRVSQQDIDALRDSTRKP